MPGSPDFPSAWNCPSIMPLPSQISRSWLFYWVSSLPFPFCSSWSARKALGLFLSRRRTKRRQRKVKKRRHWSLANTFSPLAARCKFVPCLRTRLHGLPSFQTVLRSLRAQGDVTKEIKDLQEEDFYELVAKEKKMTFWKFLRTQNFRWPIVTTIVLMAGSQLSGINGVGEKKSYLKSLLKTKKPQTNHSMDLRVCWNTWSSYFLFCNRQKPQISFFLFSLPPPIFFFVFVFQCHLHHNPSFFFPSGYRCSFTPRKSTQWWGYPKASQRSFL